EIIWFNQAHLFHISGYSFMAADLSENIGEAKLPRNVYFADGTPIEDADIAAIQAAFDKNELSFDWQAGDVLLLDNMRFCHGRNPFIGDRKILVSMNHFLMQDADSIKE